MQINKLIWIIKMAWRDSRSNRKKLFLFMSAIIVGVAALVAITSFRENLTESVDSQAKELLGADLEVDSNTPFPDTLRTYLDGLGGDETKALEFSSMAFFPETGATRLSQITAIKGAFPYYGELVTTPASAAAEFQNDNAALVDAAIMKQFGIEPGDSVKIGQITYKIAGALEEIPGQSAAQSFVGPPVYIPLETVEETGLLQRGSRLEYVSLFLFPDGTDMVQIEEELDNLRDEANIRFGFDTVRERQEEVGEAISFVSNFLNLVGFIALLLGGLGVASSIYVYIRFKVQSIAVLRCVGVSSDQAMWIYLVQAIGMGLLGSVIGALAGTGIQYYLPVLVIEFFPVDVELSVSWVAVALGLATGLAISVIFALIPLLAVRKISPLYTLRSAEINLLGLLSKSSKTGLSLVVILFITLYAWMMTGEILAALAFTGGLIFCLLILTGMAKLIMKSARSLISNSWPYEWRQGLANLYRPNNQTTTLLLTFGLGVTLISAIFLMQDLLLNRIAFDDQQDLPNIALFDVQYDQNEGVNEIIRSNGFEIIQNVPIVTMRLGEINGRTVNEIADDTSSGARRWALTREFRSTYRDSLIGSETLKTGEFIGTWENGDGLPPVSVEAGMMEDLDISPGDTLTWNVQGIPIQTYVSSTREVEWDRPQPNFFMVFPTGVLESAPQFFATTILTPDRQSSVALQQEIVRAYPNVSAIDIGQLIDDIRLIIGKVTFVIQFIGLFSILTGLIVLAGSTSISRFQRIRETVLLRTLGAFKKQVIKIQFIEYIFLGLMASLTGLLLSVAGSFLIAVFYFEIPYEINSLVLLAEAGILILLVCAIGFMNTRGIHDRPPLEVLRAEAA